MNINELKNTIRKTIKEEMDAKRKVKAVTILRKVSQKLAAVDPDSADVIEDVIDMIS